MMTQQSGTEKTKFWLPGPNAAAVTGDRRLRKFHHSHSACFWCPTVVFGDWVFLFLWSPGWGERHPFLLSPSFFFSLPSPAFGLSPQLWPLCFDGQPSWRDTRGVPQSYLAYRDHYIRAIRDRSSGHWSIILVAREDSMLP